MKKICILAVMAVMAVAASAQLYVGGSVGAWYNDNDGDDLTTITIMPEIGYNLNSKWAVGTTIGYQYQHLHSDLPVILGGDGSINVNLFTFAPYARYTFFKSGIVGLFCDGTVGFSAGKTSGELIDDDTACVWNIGFRPGISFTLGEHCSIVAHVGFLGYQGANNAAKDAGYNEEGGLRLSGNNLSFGFYYTF